MHRFSFLYAHPTRFHKKIALNANSIKKCFVIYFSKFNFGLKFTLLLRVHLPRKPKQNCFTNFKIHLL